MKNEQNSIKILKFQASMQADAEGLLKSCFAALGWAYEPAGRHRDIANITESYMRNGCLWCLFDHGILAGIIAIRSLDKDNTIAEIKRLYVAPEYQRRGYGALLFDTAINYAVENKFARIRADTRRDRMAVSHLLYKYGFAEIERYNGNEYAELFFELDLTQNRNKLPGEILRCPWANADPLSRHYHDTEWCIPCHDERRLFRMLILEGKQAGLSWYGILKKMDTLREAFDDFDPRLLAEYDEKKIERLLQNPGIIRNRLKVSAAITNARAYFELCKRYGSLDHYLWAFTGGRQVIGNWETQEQVPTTTPLSDEISRELKQLGFKFVGPTIIYSYLQAVGVVNDHLITCDFRNVC